MRLNVLIQDVIHLPKLWAIYDAKLDAVWRAKSENEAVWRLQLAKQDVYYGKSEITPPSPPVPCRVFLLSLRLDGNMALGPF